MLSTSRAIGERILAGRVASGISLKQFAARLDVYPQAVQRWQTGENVPGLKTAGRIVEVLRAAGVDITLEELVYGDGEERALAEAQSRGEEGKGEEELARRRGDAEGEPEGNSPERAPRGAEKSVEVLITE